LCQTVQGLTDMQAAERSTPSQLCLAGIVKHVAYVENRWINFILDGPDALRFSEESMAAHAGSFEVEPGESLLVLLGRYDEIAARTARVVESLPSLDEVQPLPEAPWFPPGAKWSARSVLLHILAETAQHSGHADIVREALDGAKTMG
jgi:hypothetical protein